MLNRFMPFIKNNIVFINSGLSLTSLSIQVAILYENNLKMIKNNIQNIEKN